MHELLQLVFEIFGEFFWEFVHDYLFMRIAEWTERFWRG
jgi:hypothetical protein